ncbi:unnamed protein product [Rhizoctonia solani]|nr:unnamed protein product [Rhizoctonia solani]
MDRHSSAEENDVGLLEVLYKDPDSNSSEQRYKRLHQWRPLSWNPFDVQDQDGMAREDEEYLHLLEQSPTSPQPTSLDTPVVMPKTESNQLLNPGPAWVNLFYDLAWTATFSSLTQNGQFDTVWDTLSYTAFFVVVWWLWASQVLYSINFYTDDWFHLLSIFLQMGVFGLLAATTRGYDITTYILHSPGMPGILDPQPLDNITDPERYNDEVTARDSIRVIALSIAISRVILLVQHLRVFAYAHFTVRNRRGRSYHIPRKLYVIPVGLAISTTLFFIAWGLTWSTFGSSVSGAKLKYVLWGSGLIVEVFSHIHMSRISWGRVHFSQLAGSIWKLGDKDGAAILDDTATASPESLVTSLPPELPVPQSDVTLGSRLEAITTIILGEGINGIAGTLYSIVSAPGLEGPIIVNIICSGFIVYFLAFLYFEGPSSSHMEPNNKAQRKIYWLLLHLPFLLCVVLLLQGELDNYISRLFVLSPSSLGVKNQFMLTSFLSTARKIATDLEDVDNDLLVIWSQPDIKTNGTLIKKLINYNITWSQEYDILAQRMSRGSLLQTNISTPLSNEQKEELYIWHWRLSLRALVRIHTIFMGHNNVPRATQLRIDDYYQNKTAPRQDHNTPSDAYADLNYYQILEQILKHSVQSARYIMVLVGLIFILLGALDLAHSKPRDRFQCGTIISRFLMGWAFFSLLLLNVGNQQTLWVSKRDEHEQAGVFLWISSYWVLPTIALAFGVQLLVETTLVWLSALVRERGQVHSTVPLARMAWRSLRRGVMNPFRLFHKRI